MKNIFKFICCGSVDDGKSTLIGRLLLDTNNVKKDQLEDALRASKRLGSDKLEFSMLLDGLLSEREQQITIDIAHRYFDWDDVRFHILDCPGHEQYTKNMAIAAATVDTAVLVVDCVRGITSQTRKHLEICKKFNLKNICCCLTKVDLLYDEDKDRVIDLLKSELNEFSFDFETFDIIPVSAITGYNVDKVLENLVKYSQEEKQEISSKIMHVHSITVHEGKRYYYVSPAGDFTVEAGEKYYLYGQTNNALCATIVEVVGYGCFRLEEDIDVQQGDVFSSGQLIGKDVFNADIIWFEEPTQDMLIKHGTRIAKIVSVNQGVVQTDKLLFVSAIKQLKANSLGIIIDNVSKKTIGCVVFNDEMEENPSKISLYITKENIVFDKNIIFQVGKENILKVVQYLQEKGYGATLEE